MLKLNGNLKTASTSPNAKLEDIVQRSLAISFPSWPLQNTVAVNPFWFYRDQNYETALESLSSVTQANLIAPIQSFIEKLKSGQLSNSSLMEALRIARKSYPHLPQERDTFLKLCNECLDSKTKFVSTFASYLDLKNPEKFSWAEFITSEVGKWVAAYLDERQGVAQLPSKTASFWRCWIEGQSYDSSMDFRGALGFSKRTLRFKERTSMEAIAQIVACLEGLESGIQLYYFQALLASVLGWSTAFRYLEWQDQLGYSVRLNATLVDLLAVRLVYDFLLFEAIRHEKPNLSKGWIQSLNAMASEEELSGQPSKISLQYVFQLATEIEYQKSLLQKFRREKLPPIMDAKAQLIFCIDVRSEVLRRAIESENPDIQTIGFAGFFGIPIVYHNSKRQEDESRLPVLLKPVLKGSVAKEDPFKTKNPETIDDDSYFRSLRKNSVSSFPYVELFGASYIFKMLSHALFGKRSQSIQTNHVPDLKQVAFLNGQEFSLPDQVDRAASLLQHMGLTRHFSDLILIVGHGSETTNNAFASALACGACGGHAGDFNAKILTELLNDIQVREGLRSRLIDIPSRTVFVAALHETVTDEIRILEPEKLPRDTRLEVDHLLPSLKAASFKAQKERLTARSRILDPDATRRTKNWAEIRPEWGLAGNACFIVAPRERTRGIHLDGRAFLHDYDWSKDEKSNYQTLELIMTAPMLVTNWINLQYYASTVAPHFYGSGNKLIHNLVNEMGVVEGNRGDLRVGLPLQSVHDGSKFVHEPLRLTVIIEAPVSKIEEIIEKHQTVKDLVNHEWIHLIHIDPMSGMSKRRHRSGEYLDIGLL